MAYEMFSGDKSNSIRIEGATYLVSALQSLAPTIGRKYLKAAIDKSVVPMQAALLANTPLGPTGILRAAVGANSVYYKSGVAFGVVGYKRSVSQDTADQKGYHSHFVEFGTEDRVPKRGPFLSSFGIRDWRPAGWQGDKSWPMVARRVRGARSLHPLGNAFSATSGQCRDILVREMESGLEKGIAEQARKGL
jgi:hypothetical protein